MLVNCSKEFDDICFAIKSLNCDVEFKRIESGIEIINDTTKYTDLDSVLEFCINEYKDSRSIKEIKRIRKTLEIIPIDYSFSSYISCYNCLKDLLEKVNLKNIKYLEDMLKNYKIEYLLFYLLKIQVGEITDIEEVEDSTKLYVEQVNVGKKIQIVSGIRELYNKDDLIGKKVFFITNIKKSRIRGIESNGMILCGKQDKEIEALFVNDKIMPGTLARIEGDEFFRILPVGTIDLKKSFYKSLFDKLQIKDGQLVYDNKNIFISDELVCTKIQNGIIS